MIDLIGNELSSWPLAHLKRVRDLEYFDGPLLTEYANSKGDRYLYYWCDCDASINRWMVARVSSTHILQLTNQFIPLNLVIPGGCRDDFVYFVEIDKNRRPTRTMLVEVSDIPAGYLPDSGSYLSTAIRESDHEYSLLLEGDMSIANLSELPRIMSQAYAILYALIVLKPTRLASYPWQGGFSAVHFYRWVLNNLLPPDAKPDVRTFQYASPGFIKFTMDAKIAAEVSRLALSIAYEGNPISVATSALSSYIKTHKLNKSRMGTQALPVDHDKSLTSLTRDLLNELDIESADDLLLSVRTPFEAAKITLSIVRRLQALSRFEQHGLVKFPNQNSG
jgi:hypothetical protein